MFYKMKLRGFMGSEKHEIRRGGTEREEEKLRRAKRGRNQRQRRDIALYLSYAEVAVRVTAARGGAGLF